MPKKLLQASLKSIVSTASFVCAQTGKHHIQQTKSKAPVGQLVNAEVNSCNRKAVLASNYKHSTTKDSWTPCGNEV